MAHHGKRRKRRPICETTGKRRFRDSKEARDALRAARRHQARAASHDVPTRLTVKRRYRCPRCRGWHLTSMPAFPERPPETP